MSLGTHFKVHIIAYVISFKKSNKVYNSKINISLKMQQSVKPGRQAFLCLPGTLFFAFNLVSFIPAYVIQQTTASEKM